MEQDQKGSRWNKIVRQLKDGSDYEDEDSDGNDELDEGDNDPEKIDEDTKLALASGSKSLPNPSLVESSTIISDTVIASASGWTGCAASPPPPRGGRISTWPACY